MYSYIHNLTSSYTNKSNESTMVSSSVIMFVLAGLFFNLNLFSGISDVSTILNPKVRLILSSALSLFLPVMSYLFSEAKNAGVSGPAKRLGVADLSLRAGMILAWMLLVELLRKKVDEIHMRGYSGTIQRAGRVFWLGNLVFFNIGNTGRKAVFSILWILCATKLVQRIAFTEIGKRSYAHGKNPWLIRSYMVQMLQHSHQEEYHSQQDDDVEQAAAVDVGDELLKRCKYIVMGEEKLVEATTADGYKVNKINPQDGSVVTVGTVWELAEKDKFFTSLDEKQNLRRLCLSFALFKLLRPRFEHLPAATDEEVHDCRDIILKGLSNNGERTAEAVFQVMNDEIAFLSEYYHSVVPVVLASPNFLLVNYFLLYIVVAILCLITIVICGNGDVSYAFSSILTDNYTLRQLTIVCHTPHLVPNNLKQSIIEYLVQHDSGAADYIPLTNGTSALRRNRLFDQLSWACSSDSVAQVVLTWHIATSILEVMCAPQTKEEVALSRVATRLSKYCAYLVAFHPELLPGYQEEAELVLEDMKQELKGMLGCREYYLSWPHARVDKILEVKEASSEAANQGETTGQSDDQYKVVMKGAELGRMLMAEANNDLELAWKVLADVWTELIVFMAASNDEERVKGHEEVLAQGGEFITMLWALTTHIGISRPPTNK
nr:unnamed protein product [Digitaria exilis]